MIKQEKILQQAIDHCTNRFINQGKPLNQHKMQDPNQKADEAIDETKVDAPELAEGVSDDETKGDVIPDEVNE